VLTRHRLCNVFVVALLLYVNSLGSDAVTYAAMLEYVKAFPWLLKQHLQVGSLQLQYTAYSYMHAVLTFTDVVLCV
jgi:hypothetical protein